MTATLDQLRARIARIEGHLPDLSSPGGQYSVVPTGCPQIDSALPWQGLTGPASLGPGLNPGLSGRGLLAGAIHEILSPDPDDGAATGFLLRLARAFLQARNGAFLWASCRTDLYGPGLQNAGIDLARTVMARGSNAQDILWTIEEGLSNPGLAVVAAETGPVDFSFSRRLQLTAADKGIPLILLCPERRELWPSAAMTRWRVAAAPGGRSEVELLRCRGGRPGKWVI